MFSISYCNAQVLGELENDSTFYWNGLSIPLNKHDYVYNADGKSEFSAEFGKLGAELRISMIDPMGLSIEEYFATQEAESRSTLDFITKKYDVIAQDKFEFNSCNLLWKKYQYIEKTTYYKYRGLHFMFINNDILYDIVIVTTAPIFNKRESHYFDFINSIDLNKEYNVIWKTALPYWYTNDFPVGKWTLKAGNSNISNATYLRFTANRDIEFYDNLDKLVYKERLNVTEDNEIMYFMKDGNLEQIKVLEHSSDQLKLEFTAFDGTTKVNLYENY
ncbi:MAG: hypothetical protein CMO01_09835 [Thalassobius sp.]|nr:hypothetical protein [Thalassovita sp.]